MDIRTRRLPPEYQEVEWISTTGTQYIDTGVQLDYSEQFSLQTTISLSGRGLRQALFSNFYVGAEPSSVWCEIYSNNKFRFGFSTTNIYFFDIKNINEKHFVSFNHDNGMNSIVVDNESSQLYTDERTTLSGANLLLFRDYRTNIFTNKYYCYGVKIIVSNQLLRNYIPCYRKSDNEIGMYDLVNDVFYNNKGTGAFTKGSDIFTTKSITIPQGNVKKIEINGKKVWENPFAGYRRLSYLKSSGQQYIDTNYFLSSATKIKLNITFNSLSDQRFMGGNTLFAASGLYSGAFAIRVANSWKEKQWTHPILTDTRNSIDISLQNGVLSVVKDGIEEMNYSISQSLQDTSSFYLFRSHTDVRNYLLGEFSGCKLYDYAVCSRDYYPVERISDGKLGLLDLCGSICPLTGTNFYINAGTGEFIKGDYL